MGQTRNLRSEHDHHHVHQRSTYLPMLCSRPSIKEVSQIPPQRKDQHDQVAFSNDPLSPRIGCMGQIKRNNRVVGFPASSNRVSLLLFTTVTTRRNTFRYSKLRKLFSSKNLSPPNPTIAPTASKCASTVTPQNNKDYRSGDSCVSKKISIGDMDPPLPVIKRVQKSEEVESLWKRRSGGVALKSLQLQQATHYHPKHHQFQPTTV